MNFLKTTLIQQKFLSLSIIFPRLAEKDTVYFFAFFRYNEENDRVCPVSPQGTLFFILPPGAHR